MTTPSDDAEKGERWSPINGRTPWFVHLLVWAVKNNVLWNLIGTSAVVLMSAAFMGLIDNPQMTKIVAVLEKETETHDKQLKQSMTLQVSIDKLGLETLHNNMAITANGVAQKSISRGLGIMCINEAKKTPTTEDDKRCEDYIFSQ